MYDGSDQFPIPLQIKAGFMLVKSKLEHDFMISSSAAYFVVQYSRLYSRGFAADIITNYIFFSGEANAFKYLAMLIATS